MIYPTYSVIARLPSIGLTGNSFILVYFCHSFNQIWLLITVTEMNIVYVQRYAIILIPKGVGGWGGVRLQYIIILVLPGAVLVGLYVGVVDSM